jgi:hypothetical protein
MSYTVAELITKAFNLSGVVSQNLQVLSGEQQSNGLDLLNAVLSFKMSDGLLIPYYQLYPMTLVVDQELYFIPNLISIETMTFNIGPIRYSMTETARKKYFGSPRIDNTSSLPFTYHPERTLNGTNVYLYFLPNGDYPANIYGKFALGNVTFNQDLEGTFDDFYIEYLRYALAEHICSEYAIEFPPIQLNKLRSYETRLRSTSPADLEMVKYSTMNNAPGINYGDVNIGLGWRP